ncbi:MAG: GNAT family N-acetyltransferase [Bacteroidales bacterium]|nr:GNAT family N-acetyltransferase [Bacteroidales bacterium]
MDAFIFRKATINDIPFLVDTIIEAEKSGTDILSYSTIFGLTEEEVRKYLANMLAEEVDDCELSVSSFIIAESQNKIAGAASAWIEGRDGIPSSTIKGNLINYSFPEESIKRASRLHRLIHELNIDYLPNTIVLAAGYVKPEFRGRSLLTILLKKQIEDLSKQGKRVDAVYTQIFESNIPSIKSVEKLGLKIVLRKESSNEEITKYLPSNKKLFLRKEL